MMIDSIGFLDYDKYICIYTYTYNIDYTINRQLSYICTIYTIYTVNVFRRTHIRKSTSTQVCQHVNVQSSINSINTKLEKSVFNRSCSRDDMSDTLWVSTCGQDVVGICLTYAVSMLIVIDTIQSLYESTCYTRLLYKFQFVQRFNASFQTFIHAEERQTHLMSGHLPQPTCPFLS